MSDLKDTLMNKIRSEEVKMRSKNFFVFMKALFEIGIIALILLAIFFLNLSFYLPRRRFEMMMDRPERPFLFLLSNTPWQFVLLAAFAIAVLIWVLYKHTNLYKKNLLWLLAGIIALILFISYLSSQSKVNERLEKRRDMRHFYPGQYERQFDGSGPGMRRNLPPQ